MALQCSLLKKRKGRIKGKGGFKKIGEKFGKLGELAPPYSAAMASSFKLHTSIDSGE